jgi:hypothetical protein
MDEEVPRSGILLDRSSEGALEPGVTGSFEVRVSGSAMPVVGSGVEGSGTAA